MDTSKLAIGIFDSGVGGLTVLSALVKRLPEESFVYLGDIARLPYGIKSDETISKYAAQASNCLVKRQIKCLVIACNTATAAALPALREIYPHIPIVGVIEPGAEAAVAASKNGHILVLATEATVKSAAYEKAILAKNKKAVVETIACSLFVSIAEEGWVGPSYSTHDCPIAEAIARRYLQHVFPAEKEKNSLTPDCVVLGCTHFPLLAPVLQKVVGKDVILVDSAETTAKAVEYELVKRGIQAKDISRNKKPFSSITFLTTDSPERFARTGSLFLSMDIASSMVELVTL